MGRKTKRQKFAHSFTRHHNGRFGRRIGYRPESPGISDTNSESSMDPEPFVPPDAPADEVFIVEKIWAKRRVNDVSFYLVQWEGYGTDMSWEPMSHIPWRLLAAFEHTNRAFVWVAHSTRGRARPPPTHAPSRQSLRLRGRGATADSDALFTELLASLQDDAGGVGALHPLVDPYYNSPTPTDGLLLSALPEDASYLLDALYAPVLTLEPGFPSDEGSPVDLWQVNNLQSQAVPHGAPVNHQSKASTPNPTIVTGKTDARRQRLSSSNKARDERKAELVYLHKKVEQMQAALSKMKMATSALTTQDPNAMVPRLPRLRALGARKVAAVNNMWEEVAARQCKERRRAEMENIRLKALVESQMKVARNLEKMFNKRHNDRVMESIGGQQHTALVKQTINVDDDAAIFRDLLAGIENALVEVDQDFEANGLARMVKPYHDAQLRQDDGDGVVMEVFANKIMPFKLEATADAVWEHAAHSMELIPGRLVFEKQRKDLATSDDTLAESYGLELAGRDKSSCTLHVRQILRKVVQEDRIIVAWRAHGQILELSGECMDSIYLNEKGYVVVKMAASSAASHSLMQTCCIIRPETHRVVSNAKRKVGALTDLFLESVARTINSSHQMIENMLLDKAVGVKCSTSAV